MGLLDWTLEPVRDLSGAAMIPPTPHSTMPTVSFILPVPRLFCGDFIACRKVFQRSNYHLVNQVASEIRVQYQHFLLDD